MAGMYAVYHGPEGVKAIAGSVHERAKILAATLRKMGVELKSDSFFDTIAIACIYYGLT